MDEEQYVLVPWDALEDDTLQRLVEEFVTRDGTDYGESEVALDVRVRQVLDGLRRKLYLIVFDVAEQSTQIVEALAWRSQSSASSPCNQGRRRT